jgi:hypothetical protein
MRVHPQTPAVTSQFRLLCQQPQLFCGTQRVLSVLMHCWLLTLPVVLAAVQ